MHGFCGRNALNQRFLKTRRAGSVVFCATQESHLQIALSQTDKKWDGIKFLHENGHLIARYIPVIGDGFSLLLVRDVKISMR